jgi:hypothetical protein
MAAGATYEPIATYTTVSGDKSITFSSIPGTYTDLVIIGQWGDSNDSSQSLQVELNGDNTSNGYSFTRLAGSGTTVYAGRYTSQVAGNVNQWVGARNNLNLSFKVDFLNYSNSTTHKTYLYRANMVTGADPGTEVGVNLWRSTAAITSIKLRNGGGVYNMVVGSKFTLYGIAAA